MASNWVGVWLAVSAGAAPYLKTVHRPLVTQCSAVPLLSGAEGTPHSQSPRRTLLVEFTCRACGARTARLVNPQAYTSGTCIVQCQACKKHHIIADHLDYIERGFSTVVEWARSKGIPDILLKDLAEISPDDTEVSDQRSGEDFSETA